MKEEEEEGSFIRYLRALLEGHGDVLQAAVDGEPTRRGPRGDDDVGRRVEQRHHVDVVVHGLTVLDRAERVVRHRILGRVRRTGDGGISQQNAYR